MPRKLKLIVASLVIITLANVSAVVISLKQSAKQKESAAPGVVHVIANARQKKVDNKQLGSIKDSGTYKFETLQSSKLQQGDVGRLSVLASPQGANFVTALASNTNISDKLNNGWTTKDLAVDRLWQPGGCASKPTSFLQHKYIFIDDGKTFPTDQYSSYILYDITQGSYRYFGGNNFSDVQAKQERILKVVDENDQLVFYIDVPDIKGPLAGSSTYKHAQGNEAGYIIRRVISPSDLSYKDYRLTYTLPSSVRYYFTNYGYDDNLMFTVDGTGERYAAGVGSSKLTASLYKDKIVTDKFVDDIPPTALETQLNPVLTQKLPLFVTPGSANPTNTANFEVKEFGSSSNLQMLVASNKATAYTTPLVYNTDGNSVDMATSQPILSFENFVPLGVY